MRPDNQEMRSDMEEQEVEPSEVFVDLGMLIVEGRVPGLTERGYGEGPHCPSVHPGPQSKHECDSQVSQCQRQENFCKHMLLLYKNNIPMSVEVLLCPDCCYGKDDSSKHSSGATAAVPEPTYVLLEQWTLQMISTRVPEVTLSARGLLQAVRSYLHFSQLSAWYSLSKGKTPKNIMYRICVPGETFSNKFNQTPSEHIFPLACTGKQNCMRVTVKSLPRSNNIPEVLCREHTETSRVNHIKIPDESSNDVSDDFRGLSISQNHSNGEYRHKKPRETVAQRIFALHNKLNKSPKMLDNVSDKPSDPMLGDSLLDPPQSLQMYHKRYQSPSRSGSPSLEAPEHLLSCSQKAPSWRFEKPYRTKDNRENDQSDIGHVSRPRLRKKLLSLDESLCQTSMQTNTAHFACLSTPSHEFLRADATSAQYQCQAHNEQHEQQKCNCPCSQPDHLLPYIALLNGSKNGKFQFQKPLSKLVTSEKPHYTSFSCKQHVELRNKMEENVKYVYHPVKNDLEKRNVSVQTDTSDFISLPHSKTWSMGLCHLPSNISAIHDCQVDYHREIDAKDCNESNGHAVPSENQKAIFRRSLDSATSMVFHNRSGLPLTSSPAPIRKGRCFDFDSTITSVRDIKRALFDKENSEDFFRNNKTRLFSSSAPASTTTNSLLGNFEESVLNGRLEPVSTVEGFTAEIGASGSFCPNHITVPVTVFFYTLQDNHKVTSPYLGHVNLGRKGYHVPKKGTIQVTLFNPHRTVVKMFVVMYNFSDMPANSQTFLRQRILYMPSTANEDDEESQAWLRYLLHLRFCSSKSGKVYLHTDLRMVIFRKSDMDAATLHENQNALSYELRSFTHGPTNPKFSPIK